MTERSTQPKVRSSLDGRLLGGLLLALLVTCAVYQPVLHYDFVEWDDPYYVTENVHVRGGLSANGIAWAFRSIELGNWHPLTWLSHMLDVSLFGLAARGHHLTSLLLHLANTVLLFGALRRLTGSPWRSLAVAAMFALHPLHVESVAWVAERKDVLSTSFWFVVLWAHARFAGGPTPARHALVALSFALGLMAKPMLVTVPLTLLIVDDWPLGRAKRGNLASWWPLAVEKLPLFAMALATSLITLLAQKSHGAVTDSPLAVRTANAVLGYCAYLEKTLWPSGLSAFYPYQLHPSGAEVAWKAAVLVLVTAAVAWFGRRRPYLWAGWLWYLVTLVPVIGLVRVGQQQMADRYTYVPLVGVFVMLVWGVAEMSASMRVPRVAKAVTGLVAMLMLAALAVASSRQVGTWKDGVTLWERAIAVGGNSPVSQNNLGVALEKAGRLEEAAAQFAEALRLEPTHSRAHGNLGRVRFAQRRFVEAIQSYEEEVRLRPEHEPARQNLGTAHYNLANSLWRAGHPDSALIEYREAIRWRPVDAGLHRALGMILGELGRHGEAATVVRRSIELDPGNAATHDLLAIVLFETGDFPGAWSEVQACRTLGGTPTPWLLEALARRMPEPR